MQIQNVNRQKELILKIVIFKIMSFAYELYILRTNNASDE